MAELERELLALAVHVELPPERDLWPGVSARLKVGPRRPRLRIAAVAVVALAAAIGIAFAVPPARSAILRFLGLEGVTIVRVEKLPPVTSRTVVIGRRTTLEGAAQRLGFRALLPDIGAPGAVYLDPSDQAVLLLYGKPAWLRIEETRLGVFAKIVTIQQQGRPRDGERQPGRVVLGDACRRRLLQPATPVRKRPDLGAERPYSAARRAVHEG